MKVDLNTILSDEDRQVMVGDEYEMSVGNWGTMKAPTVALQQSVIDASEKEGVTDLKVARMVLDGLKPFDDDDQIAGMASAVVRDFFSIVIRIGERLKELSEQSGQ